MRAARNYDGGGWVRYTRKGPENFHKGIMTNNICQSLARVCLSDVVLKVRDELHAHPVLLVHDELVYVVPTAEADGFLAKLLGYMLETPAWWPSGPPMEGKGCVSDNYVKP